MPPKDLSANKQMILLLSHVQPWKSILLLLLPLYNVVDSNCPPQDWSGLQIKYSPSNASLEVNYSSLASCFNSSAIIFELGRSCEHNDSSSLVSGTSISEHSVLFHPINPGVDVSYRLRSCDPSEGICEDLLPCSQRSSFGCRHVPIVERPFINDSLCVLTLLGDCEGAYRGRLWTSSEGCSHPELFPPLGSVVTLRRNESLCLSGGNCSACSQAVVLSCEETSSSSSSIGIYVLTDPAIMTTIVCLVLILALIFLVFLIGSRKYSSSKAASHSETATPSSSFEKQRKQPPRSLTEDDLEHISHLPRQEILLIYFPDSPRFKDLNRKFKEWLLTLDVNEVSDIYDEKISDIRDPEKWVREHLGRSEKRIILVCSRMAYEVLNSSRGSEAGLLDSHWPLLVQALGYVDGEMRGNYRNLICVRYEDLKICSRKYSSEAFNIVPGTEYVLPQHLEDIYRWIHPRNPKPEAWSEHNPFVQDFYRAIRHYQHHDDNIFTVQFASGELMY